MRQIRKNLESLRRQLPDDPSLGRVKIYADGKRMVVWDGTAHWQPSSGQFLFHFDAGSLPGPDNVRSLPRRGRIPATAAQTWYERALELHQESPEEARRAYEQAIERDPSLVQAHLDLGRLHQDAGDLRRATACYRAAIRHAPDQAAGYVYLAEAFLVQGRRRRAIVAYRRALERDAQLLHVHRRLGQLYEAEGQPVLALRHYAAEFKRQKKDRRHDRGGFPGGKPPKKQR
jgi:tetratricopeptide (TPR) repeat protein